MLEVPALLVGLRHSVAVTWTEWEGCVESVQGLFRLGVKLISLSLLPIFALGGIFCAGGPNPLPESLQWVSPCHTTTHSLLFRSSFLAAIETGLPRPGPRRAARWPSSLLSQFPRASPLLGIGPVQDAAGHSALVAEPSTDWQPDLSRPCGSDLLPITARRTIRKDPEVCAPGPACSSACRSVRLARPRSELPKQPPDRGKRSLLPVPGSRQPRHLQAADVRGQKEALLQDCKREKETEVLVSGSGKIG